MNMKTNRTLIAWLTFICLSSANLNADIVTFNGSAPDGGFVQIPLGESYVENNFAFTTTFDEVFLGDNDFEPEVGIFDDDVLWFDVFLPNDPAQVVVTRQDGRSFSAVSLIGGGIDLGTGPTSGLNLVGNLVGGGTVEQDLNWTSGTSEFESLNGFNNLESLVISGLPSSGTGFPVIDEMTFQVVPEPSSSVLLGSFLIAVSIGRRRRQSGR